MYSSLVFKQINEFFFIIKEIQKQECHVELCNSFEYFLGIHTICIRREAGMCKISYTPPDYDDDNYG